MSKELFNIDDGGRNGGAAEDRPNSVETLVSESETVGFREGEPLSHVGYSSYPRDRESLYLPNTTGILASIIASEKVADQEDLAAELGINSGDMLKDALEFHNFSLPESVDKEPDSHVEVPDGEGGTVRISKVDTFTDSGEPNWRTLRAVYHLYISLGLSVEEIGKVVDADTPDLRRSMRSMGFL